MKVALLLAGIVTAAPSPATAEPCDEAVAGPVAVRFATVVRGPNKLETVQFTLENRSSLPVSVAFLREGMTVGFCPDLSNSSIPLVSSAWFQWTEGLVLAPGETKAQFASSDPECPVESEAVWLAGSLLVRLLSDEVTTTELWLGSPKRQSRTLAECSRTWRVPSPLR